MGIAQIFKMPPEWIPNPLVLENYSTALTVLPFGRYTLNTMLLVVNGVAGAVITSSLSAYSFARLTWPGKKVFFALIMSGIMLPYAVTLIPTFLGWRYIVGSDSFLPLLVPAWFGGGAFNIFLVRQFMLGIPRELEEAALEDDYFIERKLYPNVDFYSGVILRALGIPTSMFTAIFAIGRMPGWIAHWYEDRFITRGRIHRPRQVYTGPVDQPYVPVEERS